MGEPEAKRARTAAVVEPDGLKCSITLELLRDPVCNSVGNTYERAAIVAHLAKPGPLRDPLTNEALANKMLVPNQSLRRFVQDFLDAHPDYTPEGWESRTAVPPLPGAVQAALEEVKAAKSVPSLLAALAAMPNSVEVQAAGFSALTVQILRGDDEVKKQARESEAYGLVLAAMRSYRSHVKLQTEACYLLPKLYNSLPFSRTGLTSGAALVERVLAAATTHGDDARCAPVACYALWHMLENGEWARAAVQQGGLKAVLALMSAHSADALLRVTDMCTLCHMVEHADWASVSSEAGNILAAAMQGLSAASVEDSNRQGECVNVLVLLVCKDASFAAQVIASGSFDLTIKAMRADLGRELLQRHGCSFLHHLAGSPSISALSRLQLCGAQEAVVAAMESHSSRAAVQKAGIEALKALQSLIRRHLCATVEAGRAAHPGIIGGAFAADAIACIACTPLAPAPAAGAASAAGS